MQYNPAAIKVVLITVATDQWLSVSEFTTLVALELGILEPDRDLRDHVAFQLGVLNDLWIESKRALIDTDDYYYVSRKYTPPDLKDVETEDAEDARRIQALSAQLMEMFGADPVMAQIYKTKQSKSGQPFVICRRHYDATQERLAKFIPDVIIRKVAHVPVSRECLHCKKEKERQTHADPQERS